MSTQNEFPKPEIGRDKKGRIEFKGFPIYAGSSGANDPAIIECALQLWRIANALEKIAAKE